MQVGVTRMSPAGAASIWTVRVLLVESVVILLWGLTLTKIDMEALREPDTRFFLMVPASYVAAVIFSLWPRLGASVAGGLAVAVLVAVGPIMFFLTPGSLVYL